LATAIFSTSSRAFRRLPLASGRVELPYSNRHSEIWRLRLAAWATPMISKLQKENAF